MSTARQSNPPPSTVSILTVALCTAGVAVVLVEMSLGGVLCVTFSTKPYRVRPEYLLLALVSVYAGAVIGAPLLGWQAARRGTRKVLILTLLWVGITSLLGMANSNLGWFTFCRFLSGIALGAYPPLVIAYLSSVAPQRYRAPLIFAVCAFASLAPAAALAAVQALTPSYHFGIDPWRWPFVVGGFLALVAGAAFEWAPEAPRVRPIPRSHQAALSRWSLLVMLIYFIPPWALRGYPLLAATVWPVAATLIVLRWFQPDSGKRHAIVPE